MPKTKAKAAAAVAVALAELTTIPLELIVTSQLNPRKHFDEEKLADLARNIQAQGLLQNLIVRPFGPEYEVLAGERRLRALRMLRAGGLIPEGYGVSVKIVDVPDAEALEIATSENDLRAEMHPMERADAYAAMSAKGMSIDEISARMGFSKSVIKEQLALSQRAAPIVKELFIQDVIKMEQLQAFTLLTIPEQEAYVESRKKLEYAPEDYEVDAEQVAAAGLTYDEEFEAYVDEDGEAYDGDDPPSRVKEGAVPTVRYPIEGAWAISWLAKNTKIALDRAQFDLEVYKAKGGTIWEDVFGTKETAYFEHPAIFLECQREAMEGFAAEFRAQGGKAWVEQEEPNPDFFCETAGENTYWLDKRGAVHVRENYAPKTILLKDYVPPTPVAEVKQKKVIVNRKRQRLEDKAINRAVEKTLMDDPRKTSELFILTLMGVGGSRLSLQTPFSNPHEGYHDSAALNTVRKFYDALLERGVQLGSTYNAKDGDPLLLLGSRKAVTLTAVRETIATLSDAQLDGLVQSLMVLTLEPIVDGRIPEAHQFVLDTYQPDKAEFFTLDQAYLDILKGDELKEIARSFGVNQDKSSRKEVHEFLSTYPRLREYTPERLRSGSDANAPAAEDEPPFNAEAACEVCGVACEYDGDVALCEQCESELAEAA